MQLDEFYNASSKIGNNWLLSQANGGNTSVKVNSDLLIKASGTSLFQNKEEIKNIFIYKSLATTSKRASMESPIHELIPKKYVFHYHPIRYLVCSIIGKSELIKTYLNKNKINCQCIDYKEPGNDLANAIRKLLIRDNTIELFLLENHGIVICGDSINKIEKLSDKLDSVYLKVLKESINNYLEIEKLIDNNPKVMQEINSIKINESHFDAIKIGLEMINGNGCLFPDQSVYLGRVDKMFISNNKKNKDKIFDLRKDEIKIISFQTKSTTIVEYAWVTFFLVLVIGYSKNIEKLNLISVNSSLALSKNSDEIYRKKLVT